MSDLLKEAIADAKAVRETALQNAKAALEEAFTPQLKSMLSAKLQEDEFDEDLHAGYHEDEHEDEDEVDNESGKPKPLGKDWKPTKEHGEYALREKVDLDKAAIIFRNWAAGKKRANWNLCFTNALLNDNWMKRVAPDKGQRAADGSGIKRIKVQ